MNERIEALTRMTLAGEMAVPTVTTEFDREDLFLPDEKRKVKRLCEYIRNQEPLITPYSALTGFFRFDGSVVGDAFGRSGHEETQKLMAQFYLKTVRGISTMEWQHATADYRRVLCSGISGIREAVDASRRVHSEPAELDFLQGLDDCALAMIDWQHKCARRAAEAAAASEDAQHRADLERLADALTRVPEQPPKTFFEAVLCVYVCFSADPDSLGTLDRYLSPFYDRDIREGRLTRDEAKAYLQELFLMVQAKTPVTSSNFTRGGESHFCIGGYLPDGSDGFCETSLLIAEAVTELPTYIPEITLRWTKKTPHEVLYRMMDMERHDPHKRIAFTNDEKRMQCYHGVCGIPWEEAVNYTMVGCNEPAFCGAITGSNSKGNVLLSMARLFSGHADELCGAADFDAFYTLYERELFADLEVILHYDDLYNLGRARDISYITSLFFNGCIENAKSLTQGGCRTVIAAPMLIGITNVIDSLITVRQFVYDEKSVSMAELCAALAADWQGYEALRSRIVNKGRFFGSGDATSDETARRLYGSFYRFYKDRTNVFGYHFLVGDLLGYNEHHRFFGELTAATPDGRRSGDLLKFGLGQSEGRDNAGLTALLSSIAGVDPHAIACGSTVTNFTLEKSLVDDDESFGLLVSAFETYFRKGGVHFQLTYLSREELLAAREHPENYGGLRVRVTGFSDYFVRLKDSIQRDIISRTMHDS